MFGVHSEIHNLPRDNRRGPLSRSSVKLDAVTARNQQMVPGQMPIGVRQMQRPQVPVQGQAQGNQFQGQDQRFHSQAQGQFQDQRSHGQDQRFGQNQGSLYRPQQQQFHGNDNKYAPRPAQHVQHVQPEQYVQHVQHPHLTARAAHFTQKAELAAQQYREQLQQEQRNVVRLRPSTASAASQPMQPAHDEPEPDRSGAGQEVDSSAAAGSNETVSQRLVEALTKFEQRLEEKLNDITKRLDSLEPIAKQLQHDFKAKEETVVRQGVRVNELAQKIQQLAQQVAAAAAAEVKKTPMHAQAQVDLKPMEHKIASLYNALQQVQQSTEERSYSVEAIAFHEGIPIFEEQNTQSPVVARVPKYKEVQVRFPMLKSEDNAVWCQVRFVDQRAQIVTGYVMLYGPRLQASAEFIETSVASTSASQSVSGNGEDRSMIPYFGMFSY